MRLARGKENLGSKGLRPRAALLGLLLCLPGVMAPQFSSLANPAAFSFGAGLYAGSLVSLPPPSPTHLAQATASQHQQSARRNPIEGAGKSGETPEHMLGLPGLEMGDAESSAEDRLVDRVIQRVSGQVWAAGTRLLTPDSLLSVADALQAGTLAKQGGQRLRGLQDQLLNAAIDAGIDELKRKTQNQYLRSLNIRYQTPFNGRSGSFEVDAFFSFLDLEQQSIFGQVGGLVGGDDSGFNFGLGYRHLTPSERVLLGANFFFDYSTDSELQRISLGAEAKSRALDLYFNWYHMIGTGNVAGNGVLEYTPDGLDVEVAGRLPSVPWVEVSGRYYLWFLDDEDLYRARDGNSLSGFTYSLVVQPMPLLGLELELDYPEKGSVEWGVSANLKYRFGVPLQEQVSTARVKAHDPVYRRFERVRREYKVLVRRKRSSEGGGAGLRSTALRFALSSYTLSRVIPDGGTTPRTRRIALRLDGAALPAGPDDRQLSFSFQGAALPRVVGVSRLTGEDYELEFPGSSDPDTSPWGLPDSGDGSAANPYVVTYNVPAAGLPVGTEVVFNVTPRASGSPADDAGFTITASVAGVASTSTSVTLTDQAVPLIGIGDGSGAGSAGGNSRINLQEPQGDGTTSVLNIPLFLQGITVDDLPFVLRVEVLPGATTADCRAGQPDYQIFDNSDSDAQARACPESTSDRDFSYSYSVNTLTDPVLKLEILGDALYKDFRDIQLVLQPGAEGSTEVGGSAQTIRIYDATDDLPELSLSLFDDAAEAAAATFPNECPGESGNLARTVLEQEGVAQQSVILRLCSSRPIAEDNPSAVAALEVELLEQESAVSGTSRALQEDFQGISNFNRNIPVTVARDRTRADDLPLSLAADTLQEGTEVLTLEIPAPPTPDAANCPAGNADLLCYAGSGPRYRLKAGDQNQVMVTITDNDNAQVGFDSGGDGLEITLTEGGSRSLTLTTGSNQNYGAPNAPAVWVQASSSDCAARLSVTSGDNDDAVPPVPDASPTIWQVPFATDSATAAFTVSFGEDDDRRVNQVCGLTVIANADDPSAYRPAAAGTGDSLSLQLQDNDLPSIGFSSVTGTIAEDASSQVVATLTVTTPSGTPCADLGALSFGYRFTGDGKAFLQGQALSCAGASGGPSCPATLGADAGNFQITCTGESPTSFDLTLTATPLNDAVNTGNRDVSFILLPAPANNDNYSLGSIDDFALTITEDDRVSFGFGAETLSVTEGSDSPLEVTLTGEDLPQQDIRVPVTVQGDTTDTPEAGDYRFASDNQGTALLGCESTFSGAARFCQSGPGLDASLELQVKGASAGDSVPANFPPSLWIFADDETDQNDDNEVFTLTLGTDAGNRWMIDGNNAVTVTIQDDEGVPIVTLGAAPAAVEPASANSDVNVPISVTGINALNCPDGNSLVVSYALGADGDTATLGGTNADYSDPSSTPGMVTVNCPASGESVNANIPVRLLADSFNEDNESLTITISAFPPAATTLPYQVGASRTVQLVIQDALPSGVSVDNPQIFISQDTSSTLSFTEGANQVVPVVFRVRPTSSAERTITLNLRVEDGVGDFDAVAADLQIATGDTCAVATGFPDGAVPITVPAGADRATVNLCANDDSLVEGPEGVSLELSGNTSTITSYTIEDVSDENKERSGTIADNDNNNLPVVYLGQQAGQSATVSEGSDGTGTASAFNIRVNAPSLGGATNVQFTLGNTGAPAADLADADDIAQPSGCNPAGIAPNAAHYTCTLSVSSTSASSFSFTVEGDNLDEDNETLNIAVEPQTSTYAIATDSNGNVGAELEITDNDQISALFLPPTAPPGSKLYAENLAEDASPWQVRYGYTGTLAQNVARRVVLSNVNTVANCGTPDTGGEEAGTLPATPEFAVRGDSSDYQFRDGNAASSTQLPSGAEITLQLSDLRSADGTSGGGAFWTHVRDDTDPESDEFICLRLQTVSENSAEVAAADDRYLLRIPANDLPIAQFSNAQITSVADDPSCPVENNVYECAFVREGNTDSDAGEVTFTVGLAASGRTTAVDVQVCVTTVATGNDQIGYTVTGATAGGTSCETGFTAYLVNFAASEASKTLVLKAAADTVLDAVARQALEVRLVVTGNTYLVTGNSTATLIFVDDDLEVSFSETLPSPVSEGNADSTTVMIPVNYTPANAPSAARTRDLYLRFRLGGAATRGTSGNNNDYRLFYGSMDTEITSVTNGIFEVQVNGLEIPANASSVVENFIVQIFGDLTDDPGENVMLTLLEPLEPPSAAQPYSIDSDNDSTNLVINDDDGPVTLTVNINMDHNAITEGGDRQALVFGVRCDDGGGSQTCANQGSTDAWLFFTEPEDNSGGARYGAEDGDDYTFVLSPGTVGVARTEGQSYVKIGQFTPANSGTSVVLTGSVDGKVDTIFEGTETANFRICVGALDQGACPAGRLSANPVLIPITDSNKPSLQICNGETGDGYTDCDPINVANLEIFVAETSRGVLAASSAEMVLYFETSTNTLPPSNPSATLTVSLPTPASDISAEWRRTGDKTFTLTISQPGGLNFNNSSFLRFSRLCDQLPSATTILWESDSTVRSHYTLPSALTTTSSTTGRGQYQCPNRI